MIRCILASLLLVGCASNRPAPCPTPTTPPSMPRLPPPSLPPPSDSLSLGAELKKVLAEKQPVKNTYFQINDSTLRPGQLRALARLRKWQERMGADLTCTGYADTTGRAAYNLDLARRRALAVAVHVPCRVEAVGETTLFGSLEGNRRVTILPLDFSIALNCAEKSQHLCPN